MPILQAEIKMKFTKTSIRIVLIAFIEIISFDLFYANRQGCFTVQNKNICYFQPIATSTHLMTWDEAWNVCMENNATLPVVDDRMTAKTLSTYLKSKPSGPVDMWLAGREIRTDDWWWLNGKSFGQVNSFANPNKYKAMYDTNAVITGELQYMWRWANNRKCYICQYNDNELCQNKSRPIIPWTNGCFFVNNDEALNLMDARNRCLDEGGDLATFQEDEGLDVLRNHSSLLSICKEYWVGLRQNWWIWNETATSKEIKYSNWSNYASLLNQHCLCIRLIDYKWDQSDCTAKKTFLCQTVTTTASTTANTHRTDQPTENFSPMGSPDIHTGDTPISKDLLLIIVGSVIAVAIVVVIIVVLVVVLKIPKSRGVNLRAKEKPTVRREMSAHRNENKSVKMKSIEDSDVSNHYAEIPRAVDYDDIDECRDDPQPGIVYAALEFDANKAIYEDPDFCSQRKQEGSAPAKAGTPNKSVESPTQLAAGTIYANL